MTKEIVNFYDETGPHKVPGPLSEREYQRLKSYAKENGIKHLSGHIRDGYIYITNVICHPGSKFQEWRDRERLKVPDHKHLTITGSDNDGGSGT